MSNRDIKTLFVVFGLASTLFSCKNNSNGLDDVLVTANEERLTRRDLIRVMPAGLSPQDSAAFATNYIKKWAGEVLLYQKAKENISETEEIDRLIEEYRKDLLLFEYRKQLISDKVSLEVSDDDLKAYYDENKENIKLTKPILKGLFLKVTDSSPSLSQLRNWCKSGNELAVENIEKYGLKNAMIYEYFKDKWVTFDEVINNIPYEIKDKSSFLQNNSYLEINKGGSCYFLRIYQYLLPGEVMPYEFAKEKIKGIIFNERTIDFARTLENDLYEEGLKEGFIVLPQENKK